MSTATSSDAQSDPGAADAYSALAETVERLVQKQRDLALPNTKRSGDGGDAGNGNRSNDNKRCALHELDDLALGGAG